MEQSSNWILKSSPYIKIRFWGDSTRCYDERVAPKVMIPILLCCPIETDAGGMTKEVESFHLYFITYCCHATDASRGTVWQNDIWHRSMYEAKVWNRILPYGKKLHHWLILLNILWMLMETNQWIWTQWGGGGVHSNNGESDTASTLLVQFFISTACRHLFIPGKNV